METGVIEPLLQKIRADQPDADTELVRRAFEFADRAHAGQKRRSNEPYILHCVRTAETLAEMRLPAPIIVAGLLHDVPEDTTVSLDAIRREFGPDVASMVSGITKLSKIRYRGIDRYVENLRKMFVAMASDVRVIMIKFADRIDNLETLDALQPDKRLRIALESLEIYAPIANRLGMNEIRSRIEDLAFRHAWPEEFARTAAMAKKAIGEKAGYIERVRAELTIKLKEADIPYLQIQGRLKHIYSLYLKLQKYNCDVMHIYDLIALRIIVPQMADCYATLGIIHRRWRPLKDRFKDYISVPKPNGYQSLHTTVFCDKGEIVEFQVRTAEMHEAAEQGIAAHWKYDESGKKATAALNRQLGWVKELVERTRSIRRRETTDAEFAESMRIDVFQNRIFVFTPKGDVIDLPEGATPIDFAYSVHSGLGDKCVSAKINERIVSLDDRLSSGDCCEIITDKNRRGPSPDWLKFVVTDNARGHIKTRIKGREADALASRTPASGGRKRK